MSDGSEIAALDVGGRSIKRGIVRLPDVVELVPALPIDSETHRVAVLDQLGAAADLCVGPAGCSRLAVAFPSPFDIRRGVPLMRGQGKFDSIHGVPLAPELEARVGRPLDISFCNDAVAAALGEATAGAGADSHRVLTITLGTGVGAALIDHGVPVGSVGRRAVGEIYLEPAGPRGRADDVLSARGLADLLGTDMAGVHAATSDPAAATVLERYGAELGEFLARQVEHFGPDIVVVGGGVAGAFERFEAEISRQVAVPVVASSLGARAALLGAALLHASRPTGAT